MNALSAPRRAHRGYTWEPCHGCGTTEAQRPKGKLCELCKDRIASAIAAEQARAATAEVATYIVPERIHDLPYLNEFDNRSHDERNPFTRTLHELLRAVSVKIEGNVWSMPGDAPRILQSQGYDAQRRSYELRAMPVALAPLIERLFDAAKAMTQRAHDDGQRRGQSLIAQLASGEITADTFNKQAIGEQP